MELNIKQEPELQIDINTNENTPIFGRHSSANGEDHIMSQLNLLSQKLKRMEATQNDRLNKIEMGIQSILNMLSDGRVAPQTPIDSIKRVKMDDFQKFNTLDQVKLFDLELQDEDYFNKMVNHLHHKCFSNTVGYSAIDLAFAITDVLFERKVFLEFSWRGGSKDKAKPKAAFIQLANIHALFLHVVRLRYRDYTANDLDSFFLKRIISNATSRANQKGMRAARTKTRARKALTLPQDHVDYQNCFDIHNPGSSSNFPLISEQPNVDFQRHFELTGGEDTHNDNADNDTSELFSRLQNHESVKIEPTVMMMTSSDSDESSSYNSKNKRRRNSQSFKNYSRRQIHDV